MIIRGVNIIINGSDKSDGGQFKQIWEYYPELFKEEMESYLKQKQEEEFESFKNKRRRFANQYNRRYEGDGD